MIITMITFYFLAWNYEKRNRAGPLCNNSMMEGYWAASEGVPTVHATPYVFPGGNIATEQHPYCESTSYAHQRKRKRFR